MSALADMYTSVDGAPMKAAQLRLYKAQALSAEAQAAADSGKLAGQVSYLEDYPNLKKLAKEMRNISTLSEILLWKCIQKKKVKGYTFLRQKPLLKPKIC